MSLFLFEILKIFYAPSHGWYINDLEIRKLLLASVRTRVASPTEKCLGNLYIGIIIPLAYVLYMQSFFSKNIEA